MAFLVGGHAVSPFLGGAGVCLVEKLLGPAGIISFSFSSVAGTTVIVGVQLLAGGCVVALLLAGAEALLLENLLGPA